MEIPLWYTAGFVLKNHLTAAYPYIRAENSSTVCMSIHRGFCKMLWYCRILFYFESVRSILNQRKNSIIYWFKCILQSFRLSLLTGFSELCLMCNNIECQQFIENLFQIRCKNLGAYLVEITTADENDFLKRHAEYLSKLYKRGKLLLYVFNILAHLNIGSYDLKWAFLIIPSPLKPRDICWCQRMFIVWIYIFKDIQRIPFRAENRLYGNQ